VGDFITTQFAQTSNLLRRTITVPYATEYGLSVAQWRILALLAHSPGIPFSELVEVSASDKALVSRTMSLLVARELATMISVNPERPKRMACSLTPKGKKLYQKIMPIARRSQARMLLRLTATERETLFSVLQRLRAACEPRESE
jgi:DNA-binding MarR family transcriptional regulator